MITEPRPKEGGPTKTTDDASGAPVASSGGSSAGAFGVDPANHRRFSILIADDDRGNRETLGEMLASRGFRTVLAADGGEAVELVQVDLVHLVLFDMHMPRLTGLEAFAVIRQTLDRILPAVLMTADANNDLIRQAFAAQVYSVIPKPVSANVVLHTLERALAKVYGAKYEAKPERPTEKPEPNGEEAPKTRAGTRSGDNPSRPSVN